jgi:Tfp pilus assembly protein PilN
MRAVNLIPAEERRSGRSALLSGVGGPTLGLLGALVVALVVVVAYVTLSNGVTQRRGDLARAEASAQAAEQRAAALKPYGDIAALRETSLATVRALAASRFDWTGLLAELSRRVPADVTLSTLDGQAAGADPANPAAASGATTVKLTGCTTDHSAVARMIERMRAVRGVASVTLESSAKGDAAAGGCTRSDAFALQLSVTPPAPTPAGTPATVEAAAP